MTALTVPDIRLPAELRPTDGRFGSGPSRVPPAAIEALVAAAPSYLGTSHRRDPVRSMVGRVREGLCQLLSLPDGYEVLLGVGGASLFWDAASFCLIERRSQHLVFGEFSARFAAVARAAPHLDIPEVIESPAGTHPEAIASEAVDLYALTHNETSTGVAMEIRRPTGTGSEAEGGALVAVDATSAAGGLRVDPTQFDAYYFSPQKILASEGGLWLAACSPAAIERIERLAGSGRWVPAVLDLKLALDESGRNQTYNTPALATLFFVAHQVEELCKQGGLEFAASRCERSAAVVYGWAEASEYASPFVADPTDRSQTVATIDFDPSIDSRAVTGLLRANGIVDTEPYRKLNRNQLRIAMYPAIDPEDLGILVKAIDYLVAALSG